MRVKRGDTVQVIAGKDRGKRGKILKSIPKESRVVVEKVHLIKRHTKGTGIVTREAPIHVSNVMIVCSACKKPTRVGLVFNAEGKKQRTCKRCGKPLD
jgi:large subunit ribosomal protein L24